MENGSHWQFRLIYSTGAIVKNLASNVNLSYYMDLWTLGSKLQKNYCWTFFSMTFKVISSSFKL